MFILSYSTCLIAQVYSLTVGHGAFPRTTARIRDSDPHESRRAEYVFASGMRVPTYLLLLH